MKPLTKKFLMTGAHAALATGVVIAYRNGFVSEDYDSLARVFLAANLAGTFKRGYESATGYYHERKRMAADREHFSDKTPEECAQAAEYVRAELIRLQAQEPRGRHI